MASEYGNNFAEIDRRQRHDTILSNYAHDRIKESDFLDQYSQNEINEDADYIKRLNESFDKPLENLPAADRNRIKEIKRMSEVLEAIIAEHGEASNWFGDSVFVTLTAKYDDIHNGVDVVIEFQPKEGEAEMIALAIDASMNPDFSSVNRKIMRSANRICETGTKKETNEIKYFESQITEKRGRVTHIIPVVIGLEGQNVNYLIDDCVTLIESQKQLKQDRGNKDTQNNFHEKSKILEKHPAQMVFLKEILIQLKAYDQMFNRLESQNNFKTPPEYTRQIKTLSKIIEEVIASKEKNKIFDADLGADGVFHEIQSLGKKIAQEFVPINTHTEIKKSEPTALQVTNITKPKRRLPKIYDVK